MASRSWLRGIASILAICAPTFASAQQTMSFRLQDNLVHLAASANGAPISAVLDSGTGGVVFDRDAAKRLGFAESSTTSSAVGGGSGAQPLFPISVSNLQVGPVSIDKLSGFALTLTPLSTSAGFPVEALLGGPVFMGGQIKVDYRNSRVTFRPPEAPFECKDPIPLAVINNVPVVEVSIRSKTGAAPTRLHLIVDLGTRHFAAIVGGQFLQSEAGAALLREGVLQKIGTGTGGVVTGSVVRVGELQVGVHRFDRLQVALTHDVKAFEAGQVDGSLGVPLWKAGSVSFDYPRGRLCVALGVKDGVG